MGLRYAEANEGYTSMKMFGKIALLTAISICICGCSDYRALNEKNPYFQKAEAARKASDYDSAITFYQKCLEFSPQSYKAHLQLAIIFDENKKDYPRAITHYKAFLAAVDGKQEDVQRMLQRVEKEYYEILRSKYEVEVKAEQEAKAAPTAAPAPTVVAPSPTPKPAPTPPRPAAAIDSVAELPQEIPVPSEPKQRVQTIYVVREGDNLSKISNKVYGTSKYWNDIFEANRDILPSPERLKVGQKLVIPEKTELKQR